MVPGVSSMAKKQTTVAPPDEALPDGESNRFLAKFKSSLSKRWSLTRMETLYEIADLAVFLWALDRKEDALAVAASVAAGIPAPPPFSRGGFNYNVWCPATFSHALVVHLRGVRAASSRASILQDTGIADNPASIAGTVAEAGRVAAAPVGQDTMKWECEHLARALGSMVLYSELAAAGVALFRRHSKTSGGLIPQLLSKLGARLRAA
jgi:hypothetical protein